jgi:hypothetical protein
MPASEIADNKWELEASKAPVFTAAGLAHVLLLVAFAAIFGYIFAMSVVAVTTPRQENSLEDLYKNMKHDDQGPAAKPGE